VSALDFLDEELAALERAGRLRTVRTVEARRGSEVEVGGRRLVNFASNDYLGLGVDGRLAAAAARAEQELGVGAGSSRLISGHTVVTERLEAALAEMIGAPSVRLFNSGYAANTGLLPVLAGPSDVIFSDALNHASLIDGCRLSRAKVVVYRHGDLEGLERALMAELGRRRIVITESVFSMDGDAADLSGIVAVARAREAITVVDDAHAFGVLGARGAGLGWAAGADIVVGTLGKSFGAAGAFVAGPARLADLLWNRARTLVFSTGLSTGTQAAALAGLEISRGVEGDARRSRVRELTIRLCDALQIPRVAAAIVPLVLGSEDAAVAASKQLEAEGLWVPAIRPPTVPAGSARLRITLGANHEDQALARLVAGLRGACASMFHVERSASPDVPTPSMFHVEQT